MIVYLSALDSQEKKSKFEQIYLAYRKQMYYAAFQILQHDEDSEDAVHHAFIKIAVNIEKFFERLNYFADKAKISSVILPSVRFH